MTIAACVCMVAATFVGAVVCGGVFGQGGFDEFGYNYDARLFNGWYGYYDRSIEGGWVLGTGDAWLNMKWSEDWVPMDDEPVGAWCTNHFTWFSEDYDAATWFGWYTRIAWDDHCAVPSTVEVVNDVETTNYADYEAHEFMKIMKVSDDLDAWAVYEAGGAYDAGWGTYENGVPMYIVYQDEVQVFDVSTGALLLQLSLCTAGPKGLGMPIF